MTDSTGRCHCGGVVYELSGEPLTCYACYCTDCQKESGAAFSLSLMVPRGAIRLRQGEIAENRYRRNGNVIHRHHCPDCGIALWFSSPAMADIAALKPGTLDDNTRFQPVAHLWRRSAPPWLKIDHDAAVFETQPELEALLALWNQRAAGG